MRRDSDVSLLQEVPQFQVFASYGIPVDSFVLQAVSESPVSRLLHAVSSVSRGIPVVSFVLQAVSESPVSRLLHAVSPVSRGIPVVAFDLQAAFLNDEHSFGGDTAASGFTASTCFLVLAFPGWADVGADIESSCCAMAKVTSVGAGR